MKVLSGPHSDGELKCRVVGQQFKNQGHAPRISQDGGGAGALNWQSSFFLFFVELGL